VVIIRPRHQRRRVLALACGSITIGSRVGTNLDGSATIPALHQTTIKGIPLSHFSYDCTILLVTDILLNIHIAHAKMIRRAFSFQEGET
jgi:hypothetical protein